MTEREEIQNLSYSYAFALDAGDFEAVGNLLAAGGLRPSMPGVVGDLIVGAKAITAFYSEQVITYQGHDPRTRHLISNQFIELAQDHLTADSRCYFTVLQRAPNHDYEIVVGGQYFDSFEKIDGRWRFAEKTIQVDHLNHIERHFNVADDRRAKSKGQ